MENATLLRHDHLDTDFRGLGGELSVRHVKYHSRVSELAIKAARERGRPFLDYNGRTQIGVDYLQTTTRVGRKVTAANAYLDPVKHRKNLHVMVNSLLSKVIIDPYTEVAQGVKFIYQGLSYHMLAGKEVILSAGPINSAHLLWISGVGPKKELRRFDVPVLSDLPVGMKFLGHTTFSVGISARTSWQNETIDLSEITSQDVSFKVDSQDVQDLVERGAGKLAVPLASEVITLYNNGLSDVPADNPNAEIVFMTGKHLMGPEPDDGSDAGVIGISIYDLYPETQGTLRMTGPSITDPPIVEYPFFKKRFGNSCLGSPGGYGFAWNKCLERTWNKIEQREDLRM